MSKGMDLMRVTLVHAVEVDGSNLETLTAKTEQRPAGLAGLVFDGGFVWFTDRDGRHAVPLANVKRMSVMPEPEPVAKPATKETSK